MLDRLSVAWLHFQRWYWEKGGEEIIGPTGPLAGPSPEPWAPGGARGAGYSVASRAAVSHIVRIVQAKELAKAMPDGEPKRALHDSSSLALDNTFDELCPPPLPFPWPWPGPHPMIWEIASELMAEAHRFDAGALRNSLIEAASQLVVQASKTATRRPATKS